MASNRGTLMELGISPIVRLWTVKCMDDMSGCRMAQAHAEESTVKRAYKSVALLEEL